MIVSPVHDAIRVVAGAGARARIARDGLRAGDVAAVAAAAGGPKGLTLLPLDRFVFGRWLARAPRTRLLAGASIGAWRMAACAQPDPDAALDRLQQAYLERQRYPLNPSGALVSQVCRQIVRDLIGGDAAAFLRAIEARAALRVVTARSLGPRSPRGPRAAFVRAALSNTMSRARLGAHLQRVVFAAPAGPPQAAAAPSASDASTAPGALDALDASGALSVLTNEDHPADDPGGLPGAIRAIGRPGPAVGAPVPDDGFATQTVALDAHNLEDALLASGSIPLLADPVRAIAGAPPGDYWDGGVIDYHLYWRWQAMDGLVLYPHFSSAVTAGWLDKLLPWRRHGLGAAGAGWLDNVLLVAPSPRLLARLPGGRLPDRDDFHRHGLAHDARLAAWRRAIAECERMAEAFAAFIERPDPSRLEPLAGSS